jgi:hypothetical protein
VTTSDQAVVNTMADWAALNVPGMENWKGATVMTATTARQYSSRTRPSFARDRDVDLTAGFGRRVARSGFGGGANRRSVGSPWICAFTIQQLAEVARVEARTDEYRPLSSRLDPALPSFALVSR